MGQFLDSLEEMPPQDMAEHVLDFALSFVPGARDDMTVLASPGMEKVSYSSAMTSSCFHIHENKKLGGSTIC